MVDPDDRHADDIFTLAETAALQHAIEAFWTHTEGSELRHLWITDLLSSPVAIQQFQRLSRADNCPECGHGNLPRNVWGIPSGGFQAKYQCPCGYGWITTWSDDRLGEGV